MKTTATFVVGLVLASGLTAWAEDTPGLPPHMDAALKQVASSNETAQKEGQAAIQRIFAEQIAAFAKVETPDSADRIAATLERHMAVTAYARDVLTLPTEARKSALAWALMGEHIQAVASAYARDAVERARGADQIAEMTGPEADRILARLIRDRDWIAASEAVDVCRARGASKDIVDALWERAIMGNTQPRRTPPVAKVIDFRGKKLRIVADAMAYQYVQPDPEAAEVLVEMRSPLVEAKAVAFLKQAMGKPTSPEAAAFNSMYNPTAINAYTVLEAYKPKAAVPILLEALEAKETNRQAVRNPNMGFFSSNRTPAMVLLIHISGQNPGDFELKRRNDFSGMWVTQSEKEHRAAEERIKAWYAQRKKDYPVAEKPAVEPATAPATEPATKPAKTPATMPRALPAPELPPQRRQPLIITPD